MKRISKLIALMLVFSLMFSFAACSSGFQKNYRCRCNKECRNYRYCRQPRPTDATEASGKILKVHFDVEVASMDPQIATDGTSFEVLAAVTEGLYSVDSCRNTDFSNGRIR